MNIPFIDSLVAIGTLSAAVAHEINNPATFISGNIQTIEKCRNIYPSTWNTHFELIEQCQKKKYWTSPRNVQRYDLSVIMLLRLIAIKSPALNIRRYMLLKFHVSNAVTPLSYEEVESYIESCRAVCTECNLLSLPAIKNNPFLIWLKTGCY